MIYKLGDDTPENGSMISYDEDFPEYIKFHGRFSVHCIDEIREFLLKVKKLPLVVESMND